jgi:uncharacterized membrane protein HdeD (DUF308 family)
MPLALPIPSPMERAMTSTSPAHGLGSALSTLGPRWGWAVALGVILIVCGIVALLSLVIATVVSVIWVGWMMIIAGVVEIYHGYKMTGWGRSILWMVTGALYIIGGFFAILNPLLASVVLTLILAIALIVAGAIRTWLGFKLRGEGHSGWVIASGLLTLLFGLIILIHWPLSSLYALGIILGIDLIQTGAGWFHLGLFLRRHRLRAPA